MGILYVVATPIGNLSDCSPRARDTLASADAILCEDTRVTSKLLAAFDIARPLVAYHQHSDMRRAREIVGMLRDGKTLALVTDAGTPAISDPGGALVAMVTREAPETSVIPIPGPNAAIAALSVSGFPCDEFVFLGFPPNKKGRQSFFRRLGDIESTVVFYESTHRIGKTVAEAGAVIGDRRMVVGRELTKMHETVYRGTASEVTAALASSSIKGEFVIVLEPRKRSNNVK